MVIPLQTSPQAPWKQRYRVKMILWAQLARACKTRGIVSTNQSGANQLYAWDVTSGALRSLTSVPDGIFFGSISADGRYVYYLQDNKGDEMGHFVRLPYEGGEVEDITPDMPLYSAFGLSGSSDGTVLGFTAGLQDGFHVMLLDAQNGKINSPPREIHHSRKMVFGPTLSANGKMAALTSTERATFQRQSVIVLEAATGKKIAELWDGKDAAVMASRFSPLPNDNRLLLTTNRSGHTRPLLWNPVTEERTEFEYGNLPGDISPVDWSPTGQQILLSQSFRAEQHYYLYELTKRKLTPLSHPDGAYGMNTYFASDDEVFALWEDSVHPTALIAFPTKSGGKIRTVLSAGAAIPGHPWQSVTFTSSDGQTIQGWLALPEGKGPFPTILHTHGGPEVMTTNSYFPSSQAWLDHGFAFLAINYRGSVGFGRAFREQIWGDLGHWEIEDMEAATAWLIKEGIANPKQIFLTGWSYGGYLTLLGLGKRPGLWAGGMAGMATTDWAEEYEDLSPALRGYSVAIMGGTPQEKPEEYARSSPITYANDIQAPVLIVQGRNDTRTPARPVETFVKKLQSLGKAVEVHWYDAGHAGGGVEQDIEHMELMLRFALGIVSG
ncbi:MAG: prolyl oligopeptidase family serine peptidase [Dehalococcoidales bacterium]|nr:prolyl oligopeptidase family serine peptidase [Dehalococcoidales bacterium]